MTVSNVLRINNDSDYIMKFQFRRHSKGPVSPNKQCFEENENDHLCFQGKKWLKTDQPISFLKVILSRSHRLVTLRKHQLHIIIYRCLHRLHRVPHQQSSLYRPPYACVPSLPSPSLTNLSLQVYFL